MSDHPLGLSGGAAGTASIPSFLLSPTYIGRRVPPETQAGQTRALALMENLGVARFGPQRAPRAGSAMPHKAHRLLACWRARSCSTPLALAARTALPLAASARAPSAFRASI